MATILPPPSKRQRLEVFKASKEQQDIDVVPPESGSLKINFIDSRTGAPMCDGPILVPVADATPQNLELLVNKLQGRVS